MPAPSSPSFNTLQNGLVLDASKKQYVTIPLGFGQSQPLASWSVVTRINFKSVSVRAGGGGGDGLVEVGVEEGVGANLHVNLHRPRSLSPLIVITETGHDADALIVHRLLWRWRAVRRHRPHLLLRRRLARRVTLGA